jgi:hypothetical protein
MLPTLSLVLGLAAAVSASVLEARVCADNCARALKNTLRPGAADCSALLTSTVRPTTVTKTRTSTTSVTATYVVGVTATETVLQTATEVAHLTTTVTTTAPVIFKRKTTLKPLSLPDYATPCSGEAAYTSACSCLGVFATETVTACTPRLRVTVWETETVATETVTSTVDTVSVTEVAATVTESTVDATATATAKPAERRFVLQVAGGDLNVLGQYITFESYRFVFQADAFAAQTFQVDNDLGYLYDGGRQYVTAATSSFNTLQWADRNSLGNNAPLACSRDSSDIVSCATFQDYKFFGNIYGQLTIARSQAELDQHNAPAITLKAVFV